MSSNSTSVDTNTLFPLKSMKPTSSMLPQYPSERSSMVPNKNLKLISIVCLSISISGISLTSIATAFDHLLLRLPLKINQTRTRQFLCRNRFLILWISKFTVWSAHQQQKRYVSTLLQDEKMLRKAFSVTNAYGAITVTERGALPSLSTRDLVKVVLFYPSHGLQRILVGCLKADLQQVRDELTQYNIKISSFAACIVILVEKIYTVIMTSLTVAEKSAQSAHFWAILLKRENYQFWKTMVEPFLSANKLSGYLNGSISCPPLQITTKNKTIENLAYATWKANDDHVKMLLLSSISE
ncbi:unnamed protein product [Lactuca saligna]|uniref:Retrotransposon Copia-like N-terminal domain-containing protein n=1 Tax=Lactuca saligna TaxID=75948 RepID=A0AA35ZHB2_LACSI|nr:unnamed protein product [Lactuca saligna]